MTRIAAITRAALVGALACLFSAAASASCYTVLNPKGTIVYQSPEPPVDMSLPLQAKFLRMLEDGHIRRLGGNESIAVDVRFIFATNRDLSKMVSDLMLSCSWQCRNLFPWVLIIIYSMAAAAGNPWAFFLLLASSAWQRNLAR